MIKNWIAALLLGGSVLVTNTITYVVVAPDQPAIVNQVDCIEQAKIAIREEMAKHRAAEERRRQAEIKMRQEEVNRANRNFGTIIGDEKGY